LRVRLREWEGARGRWAGGAVGGWRWQGGCGFVMGWGLFCLGLRKLYPPISFGNQSFRLAISTRLPCICFFPFDWRHSCAPPLSFPPSLAAPSQPPQWSSSLHVHFPKSNSVRVSGVLWVALSIFPRFFVSPSETTPPPPPLQRASSRWTRYTRFEVISFLSPKCCSPLKCLRFLHLPPHF